MVEIHESGAILLNNVFLGSYDAQGNFWFRLEPLNPEEMEAVFDVLLFLAGD